MGTGVFLLSAVLVSVAPPHNRGNYFDAGRHSSTPLLPIMQEELVQGIDLRIQKLNEEVSAHRDRTRAGTASLDNMRRSHRWTSQMMGLGFGATGATLALLGSTGLFHGNSFSQAEVLPVIHTIFATVGATVGTSFGWGLALSRLRPHYRTQYVLRLDLRAEEILKAADDIAWHLKSMSLPLPFWSIRRLRDFMAYMRAFPILESLMIRASIEIEQLNTEDPMLKGVERLLNDPLGVELGQEELKVRSELGLARLREIERDALLWVREQIVEAPADLNRPSSCRDTLKTIYQSGRSLQ